MGPIVEELNITIGFSTTNKIMSRLIRFVSRGRVSHAWVSFTDPVLGLRLVMQAEAWGYEVRPWERWIRENKLVAEFSVKSDLTASLRWLALSLGSKYDWRSAFLTGVRLWFGRLWRGRFSSPGRLMCAEAVIRFLQHRGIRSVESLDPELTTPVMLLDAVACSDDFKRLPQLSL